MSAWHSFVARRAFRTLAGAWSCVSAVHRSGCQRPRPFVPGGWDAERSSGTPAVRTGAVSSPAHKAPGVTAEADPSAEEAEFEPSVPLERLVEICWGRSDMLGDRSGRPAEESRANGRRSWGEVAMAS